jgi:inorganic pyrophosphatase
MRSAGADTARKGYEEKKGLGQSDIARSVRRRRQGQAARRDRNSKGSRNKFAVDPKDDIFEPKKVLPSRMAFPYDFGFVPSARADDGDPVDVLVSWMNSPFRGVCWRAVIQVEEGAGKKMVRNDRIVAVEKDAHSWDDI